MTAPLRYISVIISCIMAKEDKNIPNVNLQEWEELQQDLKRDRETGKLYREQVGPGSRVMEWLQPNALVPIGMAAVTGSLVMGMKNFMAGSKNQSFWMFMRVGCQGMTVILLGIGAVMADRQRAMQYAEYSQKRQKSE